MLRSKRYWLGLVGGLGLLVGVPDGWATAVRPPTYVWLFDATGTEAESLADTITEEFEEALVTAGCLPIVRRRNLPELQAHQQQEQRIAGADYLSPRQRRLLSTATADAVVFGKITDDVQGGQIKIAVTLEALSGVALASSSVRIIRGKRFDAEEREHRVQELAWEVCGALGLTGADSGPKGNPGAGQDRDGSGTEGDVKEVRDSDEKTVNSFRFKLRGCTAEASDILCSFLVTNLVGDRNFELSFESYMIDSDGERHEAERLFARRKLTASYADIRTVTDVPTAFSLRFPGLARSVPVIALLEVKSKGFSVQWRNVQIDGS